MYTVCTCEYVFSLKQTSPLEKKRYIVVWKMNFPHEFPPCLQVRSPANPGRLAPPSPDHHRVPSGNMNFPTGKVVQAKFKISGKWHPASHSKSNVVFFALGPRKVPDYIAREFGWIRCNMLFWQSNIVSCKANSEQRSTLYGGWHGHAANQRPGSEDF